MRAALLGSANFTALADGYTFTSFTFDAVNGATFTAIPVPEPGSWALMLAGAAAVLRLAQRKRRGVEPAAGVLASSRTSAPI